jgi:hypothetical protein
MTNRLALEQQNDANLICYNETYKSFVLVQYKSMDRGSNGPEFRWQPRDQLADEIRRMDEVLKELLKTSTGRESHELGRGSGQSLSSERWVRVRR